MNYRLLSFLWLWVVATAAAAEDASPSFAGLAGDDLAGALRRQAMPERLVTNRLGTDGVWSVIYRYATRDDGSLADFFSDSHDYVPGADPYTAPAQLTLAHIADPQWWRYATGTEQPLHDLNNLLPANDEVRRLMAGRIPAAEITVTEHTTDSGWRFGTTDLGGTEVAAYTPPSDRRGDVARILMYCATVYPASLWHAEGTAIFADGTAWPPLLSDYASTLLLKWHREDPPEAYEILRDRIIADAQGGGGNPFVSAPRLAEYLWGDAKGQPYVPETGSEAPVALKGSYSRATDSHIYFFSPYIGQGMSWRIDSTDLGSDPQPMPLDRLADGNHIIRYHSEGVSGQLLIKIMP